MRIIFIVFVSCLFFQCKKYGQDERTSLKTPCNRFHKKWFLYKMTDYKENDISHDTVFYWVNGLPNQYYIPYGTIFNFKGRGKFFCYDVGSGGTITSDNVPIAEGSYFEFRRKKSMIKFDIRMHVNSPARYLIDDYHISKLTDDELILNNRIFFRAVEK